MAIPLADARRRAGLTQEDLAAPLGVTRQAVSAWERGIASPDVSQGKMIASLLGMDLNEIDFPSRGRRRGRRRAMPPEAKEYRPTRTT